MLADGWRYLGLKPSDVYALTPREFNVLLKAQQERQYDGLEREAYVTIMRESAHRAKRPKASDLFRRPKPGEERKLAHKAEQAEEAAAWLAQFDIK